MGGMSEIWEFCRKFRRLCPPPPPEKVNFRHCTVVRTYVVHGRILRGDRFARTSPWESFNDTNQSENLTFFGFLGSTQKFFCKIETVIAIHLCVKYPFNAMFWKKLSSNCNKEQNWMSCTVSTIDTLHICTLHAYVTSLTLARSTVSPNFPWGSWARLLHLP
jgi:hypothetical protein